MPLFEVVVLEKPTEKAAKDGAVEKLVFGPKAIIAKTEQAAVLTVMSNGLPKMDINRAEVIVRPFGQA